MKCGLFLASCLLFSISAPHGAEDLLRAVSDKYESLNVYEFEGIEAASLPGNKCTLEVPINSRRHSLHGIQQ
jgi:hypothetical protein